MLRCNNTVAYDRRAMYGVAYDRPTWDTPPVVRVVATTHTYVFLPLAEQVQGLVRLDMSLTVGYGVTRFTQCVCNYMSAFGDVAIGVLSPEDDLRRTRLMRLFDRASANVAQRLVAVALIPPAVIRNGRLVFLACEDVFLAYAKEFIIDRVCYAVTHVLIGSGMPSCDRRRWAGMDLALDAMGGLTALGIFVGPYKDFCQRAARRQGRVEAELPTDALPGEREPAEAPPGAGGITAAAREEEAKSRRFGKNIVSDERCFMWVVFMRPTVEPLRVGLYDKLNTAGDEWEFAQRQREMERIGAAGDAGAGGQTYRMLQMAHHVVDGSMMEHELWLCD